MAKTTAKVVKQETTEIKQCEIFNLVKHNEKVKIAIGNTVIHSQEFDNFAEAEKAVKKRDWELVINATAYFIQMANSKK